MGLDHTTTVLQPIGLIGNPLSSVTKFQIDLGKYLVTVEKIQLYSFYLINNYMEMDY